jgi:spermidine/putrescine transport system substrate-binding protein
MSPKSKSVNSQLRSNPSFQSSRRWFLQAAGAAFSTIALSNCARTINQTNDSKSSSTAASTDSNSKTLYLYTWSDYSNDEIYQRFTEKTGIKVIADVYDANETMLVKLQAGGGDQYSIIYPSDYMVRQMIEAKLLHKLDQSKLQGFQNIMERWQSPVYDPKAQYSVPFNWGTTGLIYNTKVVKTEPDDWDYLWQHKDELTGKITLLDDVRETMGATLKLLGYSYNSTNPTQIEAAFKKLLELKPAVSAFRSSGFEEQLIAGDLGICMGYSTAGNSLPLENPQIKYVIPKSGTSIWTDTICIPAKAPNLDAAYAWINFILEPETAALAAQKLKLGTPNQAAFELLPAEVKNNTKQYPKAETIKAGEGIAPVGTAIELYDKYWTELKSA